MIRIQRWLALWIHPFVLVDCQPSAISMLVRSSLLLKMFVKSQCGLMVQTLRMIGGASICSCKGQQWAKGHIIVAQIQMILKRQKMEQNSSRISYKLVSTSIGGRNHAKSNSTLSGQIECDPAKSREKTPVFYFQAHTKSLGHGSWPKSPYSGLDESMIYLTLGWTRPLRSMVPRDPWNGLKIGTYIKYKLNFSCTIQSGPQNQHQRAYSD